MGDSFDDELLKYATSKPTKQNKRKRTSDDTDTNEEDSGSEKAWTFSSDNDGDSGASDSDSDDDVIEGGSGMNVDLEPDPWEDDLMGDVEDRRHLAGLSELEREEILYDRGELRRRNREKIEAQRALGGRQKHKKGKKEKKKKKKSSSSSSKKRRGNSSQLASRLRTSAVTPTEKKKSALEDIKLRQEISAQKKSRKLDKSDKEFDERESPIRMPDEKPQISVPRFEMKSEELNDITLKRDHLEKWVDEPYFSRAVMGCFVRVLVGEDDGKRVYRFARIVNIKEKNTYRLGKKDTNKYLVLRHGLSRSHDRSFRMEMVSNSPPTETEFTKWLEEVNKQYPRIMEKRSLYSEDYDDNVAAKNDDLFEEPPTAAQIAAKKEQILATANYQYSEADVARGVEEKARLRATRFVITKASKFELTLKKTNIQEQLDLIQSESPTSIDNATQLKNEIEAIDREWEAREAAKSTKTSENTQGDNGLPTTRPPLSRQDSFSKARKSTTAPKLATQKKNEKQTLDAWSRRRSSGFNIYEDRFEKQPPSPTEKQTTSPTSAATTEISPTKTPSKSLLEDAHNFDLDLDLGTDQVLLELPVVAPVSPTLPPASANARTLSFADYKKRRARA